jgi:hypothetical protein
VAEYTLLRGRRLDWAVAFISAATPSLRRGGMNRHLPGSSAPTNSALNPEVKRDAPMRTLHQRGSNKRQTPNPGEA